MHCRKVRYGPTHMQKSPLYSPQMNLPGENVVTNFQCIIACIFCSYSRTIYCDVTGRETRLPFRIKGEGLGPKLQFSFDSLNIENVFVNSSHAYEVYNLTHNISVYQFLF